MNHKDLKNDAPMPQITTIKYYLIKYLCNDPEIVIFLLILTV